MRHLKLFVFLAVLIVGTFVLLRATFDNASVRGQDGAVETDAINTDGLPAVGTAGEGASSAAAGPPAGDPAAVGAWQGDAAFVAEAADMNATETALADLAQRRAATDAVKRYAAELHRDHTAAGRELAALAGRKQWTLAAPIDGLQAQALAALDRAQGPAFDEAFIDAMITSHERAIAAFRVAAASTADADLRAFAATHLTTLQSHLEHARTLLKLP